MSRASPTRSIDCRTCKLRFRADRLEDAHCGKRPSKRPGEDAQCDLTEARQFNLMFETQVGAMEDGSSSRRTSVPRRRRASSSTSRTSCSSRGASRRSASRRPASRSATRSRRATSSSACASSSRWRWSTSCRPTRRSVVRVLARAALPVVPRPRAAARAAAHPRARSGGALALLERHERHRVPLPHRLAGARRRREPRRLRPDAAHGAFGHEARVGRAGRRALHAVRHRAGREHRADLRRDARRRLRRGGRRRPRPHRAAAASADRADQGGDPAADREERRDGLEGARAPERAAAPPHGRVRRRRPDRAPLPPPGRDRHAVGVHDRRPDARGRHRHRARARLARAGAAAVVRRPRAGSRTRSSGRGARRSNEARARDRRRARGARGRLRLDEDGHRDADGHDREDGHDARRP